MKKSDIGLIGLAVMGQNLALNIADHGFKISVYNRTTKTMEDFVAKNPNTPGGVVGEATLEGFVQSLSTPRKIVILVKAGKPTEAVIDSLLPLLEKGDIVIDGAWFRRSCAAAHLPERTDRYRLQHFCGHHRRAEPGDRF